MSNWHSTGSGTGNLTVFIMKNKGKTPVLLHDLALIFMLNWAKVTWGKNP